jgi:hypothetical protein
LAELKPAKFELVEGRQQVKTFLHFLAARHRLARSLISGHLAVFQHAHLRQQFRVSPSQLSQLRFLPLHAHLESHPRLLLLLFTLQRVHALFQKSLDPLLLNAYILLVFLLT